MDNLNEDNILESTLSNLDISPTDFEVARKRYLSVAKWLEDGKYLSGSKIEIYLQGSFKLGTVIRPYRKSQESDYDIDQVCEISGNTTTAKQLKLDVGGRLYANLNFRSLLDSEGKRCWTLVYSSSDKTPGFHLDILPARPQDNQLNYIDITHKVESHYNWRSSNPRGYYEWFKGKNFISNEFLANQRNEIFSKNKTLYSSVENVPKQLVRTTLQRSIQLMKRHRDVFFNNQDHKPISIIITTICAHLYRSLGILETIKRFTEYTINRHSAVIVGEELMLDNILDFRDGNWEIRNPTDNRENFAEKWKNEHKLIENFFAWVYQLNRDINAFSESKNARDLNLVTPSFNNGSSSFGQILLNEMNRGPVGNTDPFLSLIHQGIEKKVSWSNVREVATRNVKYEPETEDRKDIAWVNFYQVKIHSGECLSESNKSHIRSILTKHKSDAAFIFCCNLLLKSATLNMLRECIKARKQDVLKWPITRLAKGQITENNQIIIPVIK